MESEGIQGTMGFTTIPPGRTTTKLSPTLFCLYVQVKPYCNLWSFCLPNDEKNLFDSAIAQFISSSAWYKER